MGAGYLGRYSDWLRTGRCGIKSQLGRDFPPIQTGPGAHPASSKMGTGFSRGKCGRGVLLTTHPLLVPRSWKSRAIPLPTLWATPGLYRDHFTFTVYCTYCNLLYINFNHMRELFKLKTNAAHIIEVSLKTASLSQTQTCQRTNK